MRSKLSYANLMDPEILKKFFDGKLTSEENDYFTTLLADDELLREAFAGLNAESFSTVESISLRTNSKIDKLIAAPPLFQRWVFWLSVFIGVIVITFSTLYFFPKNNKESLVASVDNSEESERTEIKNKKKKVKSEDSKKSVESEKVSNDNTLNFNTDNSTLSREMLNKKEETNHQEVLVENKTSDNSNESEMTDGPGENKITDDKKIKDENTQNSNTNIVKKKTRLRLSDATVLISQNLAEKEASSSSNKNQDVTNPNIGSSVTTKKSNGFNIEDMPSYPGGTDALNAYVKGRLSTKSYTIDVSNISTMVEFVVTSKGKVENIKLQNQVDAAVEKDIREVLSNLKFNPGKKSGKKGSMHYMMALTYD